MSNDESCCNKQWKLGKYWNHEIGNGIKVKCSMTLNMILEMQAITPLSDPMVKYNSVLLTSDSKMREEMLNHTNLAITLSKRSFYWVIFSLKLLKTETSITWKYKNIGNDQRNIWGWNKWRVSITGHISLVSIVYLPGYKIKDKFGEGFFFSFEKKNGNTIFAAIWDLQILDDEVEQVWFIKSTHFSW